MQGLTKYPSYNGIELYKAGSLYLNAIMWMHNLKEFGCIEVKVLTLVVTLVVNVKINPKVNIIHSKGLLKYKDKNDQHLSYGENELKAKHCICQLDFSKMKVTYQPFCF